MCDENTEPKNKVRKTDCPKIGTHSGTFHCDEVLASFLLKQLEQYRNAEIVRTRDPAILDTCDIVIDVGGVFDLEKLRFDHHQKEFDESMHSLIPSKPWKTKLSSAGLIYAHYGHQVICNILKKPKEDPLIPIVFDKMYANFVHEVDAVDNGIATHDGQPRYHITTNLPSRVAGLNPWWNDEKKDEQTSFNCAYDLVGREFVDKLAFYADCWWPAKEIVGNAVKNRKQVDSSGQIIELPKGGCPWKEHLFSAETELKVDPHILFCIIESTDGSWSVVSVPEHHGEQFATRMTLLPEFLGMKNEELQNGTGIPDAVFVHSSGFMGVSKTREGAIAMANKTIEESD